MYRIVKVEADTYPLFEDMTFLRENGVRRESLLADVPEAVRKELANPNFFLYAAEAGERYVGWISLVYIPKVSRWKGHGHVYVDELWVAPEYRRQGIARALLSKADALRETLEAVGLRLYVNVENPDARKLYESCGYVGDERACFMEKYL